MLHRTLDRDQLTLHLLSMKLYFSLGKSSGCTQSSMKSKLIFCPQLSVWRFCPPCFAPATGTSPLGTRIRAAAAAAAAASRSRMTARRTPTAGYSTLVASLAAVAAAVPRRVERVLL